MTLNLQAKELGIKGDMKGDGFQNGGLLVVAGKGEKVLYEFKQDNPADHAENATILKVGKHWSCFTLTWIILYFD